MRAILGLFLAAVVSLGFMGTASAQAATTPTTAAASDECDVADFTEDGVLDTTSYMSCVAGATETNNGGTTNVAGVTQTGGTTALPATGNDASRYLVFAAVLLVLGGAAVAGSLQTRRMAATD